MNTKILLIEDNLEMRENTTEMLELSSYEVIAMENGKSGIKAAQTECPDLILCDIMMPEMDGYEVLYMLGKNPVTSAIPFIYLTAKAEKSDIREGMNLGADDYLIKPFERMDLLTAIETRLKRSEAFKGDFDSSAEGLSNFLDTARGLDKLESLSADRVTRSFSVKQDLYFEGDTPSSLLFVNKGKVKTWKMNDAGKELVTGLYNEGDFLGYLALLENGPHTESATTLEETEVSVIPKDDFLCLVHNNRDVSSKFISMLANNVQEKEERLLSLAYSSLRERVADALLQLYKQFKEEGEDEFMIKMSRENLASIAGTTTESLIRTLSDFKEEGFVRVNRSEITILDLAKLEHVSKFSF